MLTAVTNGGTVGPVALRSDLRVGVVAVFGVDRDDRLDIETRRAGFGVDRLPRGLLPIIEAEGGNVVCLSVRPGDFGTVWFWDHEQEGAGDPLTVVAEDFDEFVSSLEPIDLAGPPPSDDAAWIEPALLDEIGSDEN